MSAFDQSEENWTPLHRLGNVSGFNLFVKDESHNPTGTFKDRLIRRVLDQCSASDVIASISYGNTALSLAHALNSISPDSGRPVGVVLMPDDAGSWILGPSSLGSTISGRDVQAILERTLQVITIPVDSPRLTDSDIDAIVRSAGIDYTHSVMNITEGISTPAYAEIVKEAVVQLGRVPDVCIIPFGAGILANEAIDYLADTDCMVVPLSVSDRHSAARMLYGPMWLDVLDLAARGHSYSRHESPDRVGRRRDAYRVHRIDEDEIAQGIAVAREYGISAEPSGAVGLGILDRLSRLIPVQHDADVLVINTGNAIDFMLSTMATDGNG